MTSDIAFLDRNVGRYLGAHTTPPTPLEQRLIEKTGALQHGQMQIGFPQARFMALLARVLAPRTVIEIGVFTGYSALVVAQELAPEATLIACDVSEEWTAIGRPFWEEAGVAERIDLRIGPASETLSRLPADTSVDLAFIDADKTGYLGYVEQLIPMMHAGSVVLVDNVLWDGQIVDESDDRPNTLALREFNDAVLAYRRLDVALLPIGDGLSFITLARTR
jgi:caffeoyl-CoA O-methyltransferase